MKRITGGEGVDVVIDALGPTSFRKDYRLLRPGGRLIMYGGSEVQTGSGKRDTAAALKEPGSDAAGDHAMVEEPRGHEREQRRLRPQHAPLVGREASSTGFSTR